MSTPQAQDTYSTETYQLMALAKRSVLKYKHPYITPEHMLLSILELNSVPLQKVLAASQATPEQIRQLMKAHLRDGDTVQEESQIKFSERAKRVIEASKQEARRAGVAQVAPEHFLLGLTKVTNTVCGAVLRAVRINDKSVCQTLGLPE